MATPDNKQKIEAILVKLNSAVSNARMYFKDHPEVVRHIDGLYDDVLGTLKFQPSLTILIVDDRLVEGNKPLKLDAPLSRSLIGILKGKGIEHFTFKRGITKKEIAQFVITIAEKDHKSVKSSSCIKLGKISLEGCDTDSNGFSEGNFKFDDDAKSFQKAHGSVFEIKDLYQTIKQTKGMNTLILGDIVTAFIDVFQRGHNPIKLLSMIRNADEYTFTHVVNVCILTMTQAQALGFKGDVLFQIGIASLLHDVGKLFVPEEILKKPGALTAEERVIINGHVVKGALFILKLKDIPNIAVLGAMEHHMRYDGTGYPQIKGDYTPNIASQIIAIADAYDAMRSKRPYQPPKKKETIIEILIQEKGKAFDPLLIDNFIKLIE